MKKKTITLVALVALLAVAVAAFLLLRPGEEDIAAPGEDVAAADENTTYVLGGVPQAVVTAIAVQNTQDSYTIQNGYPDGMQPLGESESQHTIQGVALEFLNQTTLRSAFASAASLPAKKVVAQSGADMATYGLSAPSATLDITYSDGAKTLLIGDDAPGGEGTYVAVDGAVYLVATGSVSMFREPRFHFVSKTITGGNSQSTAPTRLTVSGGNFSEPVTLEKQPEDEVSGMTGFSPYLILEPIQVSADAQKGVQPLQMVFGLTATAVVADNSGAGSLSAYGLDEPYMTVGAVADDVAGFTLQISQPDSSGSCYVTSSLSPFVYQVAAESMPFLGLTLFDLQEKMIILPYIDSIAEVEVQAGDEVYLFQLSGEGDELKVTHEGNELDGANFRQFYQTLIAASYDSEIDAAGTVGESLIPEEDSATGETSTIPSKDETPDKEMQSEIDAVLSRMEDLREGQSQTDAISAPEGAQVEDPSLMQPEQGEGGGEAPAAQGDVLLRFTYRYRDGSATDVVTFERGPTRKAIVYLNDGKRYYARSVYVDRVLEDLPKVVAGETVKSYL